ncbi:uncharacterized protein LOC109711216 isoform X3 [Ananas comosus]|uniref:Uncharacterized protein LOC109711216 isoform X3 n=1 Tax=Ananas comosus TaxID=4615 RepID=A0A6P5F8X4_ANACO|nr:uncharacterized protein LOC109711216 isoform X3 [Ananas comosus]
MEIDEVGAGSDALPEKEEDESSSFSWLLGAKERFILTSERPNKKRKLLGGDAGLEHLLVLPHSHEEASTSCDLCCSQDSTFKTNKLLSCYSCKAAVHQKCYGVREVPKGSWSCSYCKHLEKDGGDRSSRPCVLCPKEGGALKPVESHSGRGGDGSTTKFAHLFCSLWIPEVYVEDIKAMEPVMNIRGVQETRKKLVCNVCKVKHGACVRCSHGTCRTSFHPMCARESKHQMEIWGKFGNENVEMRAYCSKHSSSKDISNSKNVKVTGGDDSLAAGPPSAILATRKLPKLRLSRKNNDKSMMHEFTSSSCDEVGKMDNNTEQELLANQQNSPSFQAVKQSKVVDSDGPTENGNLMRNSTDVAAILRKLIDRGKVSVRDIASEIGISSDSLEAALGETTTFSPGLKLKIIKWLQHSAHMPANVKSPLVPSDDKVTSHDKPDPVLKYLPPRRAKGSTRTSKNNKPPCPQSSDSKIIAETMDVTFVATEDEKPETNGKISSASDQNSKEKEELPEPILDDTCKLSDAASPLDFMPGANGNSVKEERNDFSGLQHGEQLIEGFSSFNDGVDHADNAKVLPRASENGYCGDFDCDADPMLFRKFAFNSDGPSSDSYIHPLVRKRLMIVQDHNFKQSNAEAYINAGLAKSGGPYHNQQEMGSACANSNQKSDVAELDQISKAKSLGILDLSAEDEVEGELVYLQARLLDNALAIKHTFEDLMSKIVKNLPQELDAFNSRKWDLILVNQFLREVKEAKKRGRKERRHKEAQAVLAAAAAAAAASSRNSALRKDSNDEIGPTNQESTPKASVGSGRVGLPTASTSRAKDSSRSALNKLSSDKNSGLFQMPDFSKDNALYCGICMRTETVLNRIFVCSSCKVAVHLDCYRCLKNPIGPWKCELCEDMSLRSTSNESDGRDRVSFVAQCRLCGGVSGAFRKTTAGQWVHAFCTEWLLESRFRRGQENLVEGMDTLHMEKDTCCICRQKVGACLECSYGDCQITFHPSCARGAGLYMNTKCMDSKLQHNAYCSKHSTEQREADIRRYGAEELDSMKQIRVRLEKLRLLCERIIKREKLKRDLVLCSHDILASKRDHVACSVLLRGSFPPGVSSESATTSINNKSYSGTVQRSDDVTVDSTVSGKRTIKFSLHNKDAERHTDDSSTSQLSFKRKLADRSTFAGKQLPHRSTSVASRNSAEDGDKKSKPRKHTLVMTSDEASMQNQRLPKGFAYVPIGSLSKEKVPPDDAVSHEPHEPGG